MAARRMATAGSGTARGTSGPPGCRAAARNDFDPADGVSPARLDGHDPVRVVQEIRPSRIAEAGCRRSRRRSRVLQQPHERLRQGGEAGRGESCARTRTRSSAVPLERRDQAVAHDVDERAWAQASSRREIVEQTLAREADRGHGNGGLEQDYAVVPRSGRPKVRVHNEAGRPVPARGDGLVLRRTSRRTRMSPRVARPREVGQAVGRGQEDAAGARGRRARRRTSRSMLPAAFRSPRRRASRHSDARSRPARRR